MTDRVLAYLWDQFLINKSRNLLSESQDEMNCWLRQTIANHTYWKAYATLFRARRKFYKWSTFPLKTDMGLAGKLPAMRQIAGNFVIFAGKNLWGIIWVILDTFGDFLHSLVTFKHF